MGPYFSGRLDAATEADDDDQPAYEEAQGQLPAHRPKVLNPARYVQHILTANRARYNGYSKGFIIIKHNTCIL